MKIFFACLTVCCFLTFGIFAQDAAPAAALVYSNPLTQISFPLPEGYKVSTATDTSVFILGPQVQGHVMSIHMNLTPVPQGVKEEQMCEINLNSFKQNTAVYMNVQEFAMAKGKAFVAEEAAKSDPTEIHRRFLMIWVNGYQTNLMVAGSYAGMAEQKGMIDQFFKSVKVPAPVPVPVEEKKSSGCSLRR